MKHDSYVEACGFRQYGEGLFHPMQSLRSVVHTSEVLRDAVELANRVKSNQKSFSIANGGLQLSAGGRVSSGLVCSITTADHPLRVG
jgi:hypothetical protein